MLGLSPGSVQVSVSKTNQESNSFLENLFGAGLIDERIFSLYLSDQENFRNSSVITVGGYDLDRFAPNATITWNPLVDTDYWTVRLKKVMLGDVQLFTSTKKAIIDSGTSYLAMPDYEFASLITLLDTD